MDIDWNNNYPTYISLPNQLDSKLPEKYHFQDIRYVPELVEYFLNRYTQEGDTVLDPFVGFGTTMIVAEKLEREGWGIEIDERKIKYLREEFEFGPRLIHGDIKRLYLKKKLPEINCIMTSPPYMGREDKANALTGYQYAGSYEGYLDEMVEIFSQLQKVMAPDGVIIVEISNLKQKDSRTTLAWDVGRRLSTVFTFRGEIIVNWTGERNSEKSGLYNYGYDHSYCLVYSNSNSL